MLVTHRVTSGRLIPRLVRSKWNIPQDSFSCFSLSCSFGWRPVGYVVERPGSESVTCWNATTTPNLFRGDTVGFRRHVSAFAFHVVDSLLFPLTSRSPFTERETTPSGGRSSAGCLRSGRSQSLSLSMDAFGRYNRLRLPSPADYKSLRPNRLGTKFTFLSYRAVFIMRNNLFELTS